ncbi:MAG: hypothetical protein H7222_06320 [Methylotenera sp.]|nr:hypothetical protein [Oligoflexia bacterium]
MKPLSKLRLPALLFPVLLLLLSTLALAADFCAGLIHAKFDAPVDEAAARISPGTTAILTHRSLKKELVTRFLGRFQLPDGSEHSYLFYDTAAEEIHLIPASRMHLSDSKDTAVKSEQVKLYVRSEMQEGGTCAAYSLYNCIRQVGMKPSPPAQVQDGLATESERLRLLMKAVDQIYVEPEPGDAVAHTIENLATEYGLKSRVISRSSKDGFRSRILKDLQTGWPVLARFDTEENMLPTAYTLISHEGPKVEPNDRDLWVPKPIKAGNFGSHAVVFLAAFEAKGEQFILVSDPNWEVPRIWPVSYLERMNTAHMAAWTIFY